MMENHLKFESEWKTWLLILSRWPQKEEELDARADLMVRFYYQQGVQREKALQQVFIDVEHIMQRLEGVQPRSRSWGLWGLMIAMAAISLLIFTHSVPEERWRGDTEVQRPSVEIVDMEGDIIGKNFGNGERSVLHVSAGQVLQILWHVPQGQKIVAWRVHNGQVERLNEMRFEVKPPETIMVMVVPLDEWKESLPESIVDGHSFPEKGIGNSYLLAFEIFSNDM